MKKNVLDFVNKFRLKHRLTVKIGKILFMFAILAVFFYLAVKFGQGSIQDFMNNSEFVIILASLLGASVGGLITYFISINSMIKANHIKASIVNKNVSYSPLYTEYNRILKAFEKEDFLHFNRSIDYKTMGSTDYTVWERLKSDTRYFQLPDYLKKECIQIDETIKEYENAVNQISKEAYNIFIYTLKQNNYEITDEKNGIRSFLKVKELINEINTVKVNLLSENKIHGLPEISKEDKEKISEEFMVSFNQTNAVKNFDASKRKLEAKIVTATKTLEVIIKRITNEYESRNNVF